MTTLTLDTAPLKLGFGSEIVGVDLATADAATLAAVVAEFHRTGAIVLRGQEMNPPAFERFARAFGPLEGHTLQDFTLPDHPDIYVLSNRVEDGRPVGAHNDGIGWHTDLNYTAEPTMCTMLHAIIVPPEGSDTLLADQVAAYAALPPERQAELARLKQIHSFEYLVNARTEGRKAVPPEVLRANPDVVHPLVRTHPRWPQGAVGFQPDAGLRGLVHSRQRAADRRTDRMGHAGALRLPAQVAGGRRTGVGQPLHAAHRHPVRRHPLHPRDASHVGEGRSALLMRRPTI